MRTAEQRDPQGPPALRAVDSNESLPVLEQPAWRQGRPVEDPNKTKRWGVVTAQPSEYLIHMRRGKVRRRSTGQGASCFKLPWDSVAIIPTTINRLQFSADQVTREKVGMRVTGLAVYRIVEPEIAFRMLNFSFAERASQKLREILQEMFVGATRRHVANLDVEQVMTRRKDAIAGALLAELAPVLDGSGRVDDTTSMGWGVVLDTVEIQDVRVLSERVFANMQATYRAKLALAARTAELEREAEIATKEADHEREVTKARVEAESESRRVRAAAESRSTEIELAEQQRRAQMKAEAEQADRARAREATVDALRIEAQLSQERSEHAETSRRGQLERRGRLVAAELELALAEHEAQMRRGQLAAQRDTATAEAQDALRAARVAASLKVKADKLQFRERREQVRLTEQRVRKEIEDTISDARIELELVQNALPAIAEAFGQQIGELRLTQIGGGSDPSAILAHGITRVLELARSFRSPAAPPEPAEPPASS